MKKIYFILTLILIFILPFIHAKFLGYFGIDSGFFVSGNFEFTKSIFFNIFSGFIILFYLIQEKQIRFHKYALILLGVLFVHLVFQYTLGDNFFTSLYGNTEKGHGTLLFINLILLSQIFLSLDKKQKDILIKILFFGSIFVNIIAIKEYLLPSFDYGDLTNRALGTFGHPNYLAGYNLILLLTLFRQKLDNTWKRDVLLLVSIFLGIFTLILTKSVIGIVLFCVYIFYRFYENIKTKKSYNKYIIYSIGVLFIIIVGYIYFERFGITTKLSSFLSRFYIWQATLAALFSQGKNIFLGAGFDSLIYTFDTYKSEYLYIFENIGYSADRPHNIFLNIFYSLGIVGLGVTLYGIYNFIKNKTKYFYATAIIFIILFLQFNFASISLYLMIVLLLSNNDNIKKVVEEKSKDFFSISTIVIVLFCFSQIQLNYGYFIEEHKRYTNNGYHSSNTHINALRSENIEKNIFQNSHSSEEACTTLLQKIPSVENYFFCGNTFWEFDQKQAKVYYKQGLSLLPDIWNPDSKYFDQYFVENLYSEKRFFSEKFSNISEILSRIQEK